MDERKDKLKRRLDEAHAELLAAVSELIPPGQPVTLVVSPQGG